jgi:hypothetical protein
MPRLALPVLLALLLATALPSGVAAAGRHATWQARLTREGSGTVTMVVYASGAAEVQLRLSNLAAGDGYTTRLYRGSCDHLGSRVLTLPTQEATTGGSIRKTISLSSSATASIVGALRGSVAVVVGGAPRCATFTAALLPGDPDPVLTPGATNPNVTPATIGRTICASGWTRTVRPPTSYTNALKRQQIAQYGYVDTSFSSYEEDHLIPLELGGAPRDPANLWPQPYAELLPDGTSVGARVKDTLENRLKRAVCAGTVTLADAQHQIASDWVRAWLSGSGSGGGGATPSPTPMPTPVHTATPLPGGGASGVTITDLTSPVNRGQRATATARTWSNAACTITVIYKSGPSEAQGLEPKAADAGGSVSWTWTVGTRTTQGSWPVTVSCSSAGSSASDTRSFVVQ